IRSRHCSHRRRVPPSRQSQRPECWFIVGRFSGDYLWPVLGDHRGSGRAITIGLCSFPVFQARISASLRAIYLPLGTLPTLLNWTSRLTCFRPHLVLLISL